MAFQLCDFQLFDDNGEPLSGGLVSVYEAGTTTEKDSYPTADDADAGTNANTNPVELDSTGRAQIWGQDEESYKLAIKTSAGVTLQTIDDITAPATSAEVEEVAEQTAKKIAPRLKVYTAGGTADALTITLDPAVTTLDTDVSFYFRPSAANTGSATVNVNGLGVVTLKLPDASTDLPAGFLQTANIYGVWYDGTNAVIVLRPEVVDSGSNAEGYYIRYADGTQICRASTTVTFGVNFRLTKTWTFPKAFSAMPSVELSRKYTANQYGGSNADVSCSWDTPTSTNVVLAVARFSSGTDFVSGDNWDINASAIGRWY